MSSLIKSSLTFLLSLTPSSYSPHQISNFLLRVLGSITCVSAVAVKKQLIYTRRVGKNSPEEETLKKCVGHTRSRVPGKPVKFLYFSFLTYQIRSDHSLSRV